MELDDKAVDELIETYLLPTVQSPQQAALGLDQGAARLRTPQLQSKFNSKPIKSPVVLFCSHNSRDSRCGIMGPLLQREFEHVVTELKGDAGETGSWRQMALSSLTACISHIGGHKFAGNMIIYFPRQLEAVAPDHPLIGKGIWYGRVEPKHIEGIMRATIMEGQVIEELFRGGITETGSTLRLPLVDSR